MRSALTGLALVILLSPAPALAASPDEAATDLSTEIMSPFCPGVTLHECPSAEALRLRDRIERWFRDGMTRDEILVRLEEEYGVGVRAAPPAEGVGLIAWIIAAAAIGGAITLAAWLTVRWSHRRTVDPGATAIDPSDRRRIDDELSRLRTGA